MNLLQLWQALWHRGSALNQTIVWELRLPRIAAALVVGAALGMSGALLQGMLRNGLADPFILGISAGAGLVAISLLTLNIFLAWLPIAAFRGRDHSSSGLLLGSLQHRYFCGAFGPRGRGSKFFVWSHSDYAVAALR